MPLHARNGRTIPCPRVLSKYDTSLHSVSQADPLIQKLTCVIDLLKAAFAVKGFTVRLR